MPDFEGHAAVLLELFRAGVEAAAPGPALSRALAAIPAPRERVWLVAVGKAAVPMAEAAIGHLASSGRRPAGGLVVAPEVPGSPPGGIAYVPGDHPFPGPHSAEAKAALDHLVHLPRGGDEVWVLLSGGATSLAASPLPGIDSEDFLRLWRDLLTSGLDIGRMNAVRKRFSTWGAGRLAVALGRARLRTFAVSDVPGDDPAAIGSGPTVPDPCTVSDVHRILRESGLDSRLPGTIEQHLARCEREGEETPKRGHAAFASAELHVVAGNRGSVRAAARRAAELGFRPVVLEEPLGGEASEAGRSLGRLVAAQQPGTCLVAGGETVVTIAPGAGGSGGRCQELVLAAAEVLRGVEGTALLAAGTDGRDGATDAAGAFAGQDTWEAIASAGLDPGACLAGHDSHPALDAVGALVRTGLTGTNVMDLVLGLRLG